MAIDTIDGLETELPLKGKLEDGKYLICKQSFDGKWNCEEQQTLFSWLREYIIIGQEAATFDFLIRHSPNDVWSQTYTSLFSLAYKSMWRIPIIILVITLYFGRPLFEVEI